MRWPPRRPLIAGAGRPADTGGEQYHYRDVGDPPGVHPGQQTPAPSAPQKVPNAHNMTPTANFIVFSGTRDNGARTAMPIPASTRMAISAATAATGTLWRLHLRADVRATSRREPGQRQSCGQCDRSQHTRDNCAESACVVRAPRSARVTGSRHSGQPDCVMMPTKSSRRKSGSKCARTSSFMVPNMVSGRSRIPS